MEIRHLCKLSYLLSSYNFSLLVGMCIGIAISLVFTPPMSLSCMKFTSTFSSSIKLPSLRDIRSNDADPEDFEPNLNLNQDIEINKNGDIQKDTSKLKRPRYYSTELGMKDKVLVSIISTTASISSFGIAMNKTLNHYVDKLIFFVDGIGSKKLGLHIPIVGFKESKPLIKIFRVLSYINENYIEDYNYFMFATDHTYINGNRLMSMLEKISVSLNIHMGMVQDNGDSLYCNLDNGIILSQSVLKEVGRELLWCTKHSFSNSHSDNLGRCILHATNLPCKSVYQEQTFISYTLQEEMDLIHFLTMNTPLESSFDSALSVRITKQPSDIYKLYIYFLKELILRTKREINFLREDITEARKLSSLDIFSSWPIGSPNPHVPRGRSDVIKWETFNATHIFMPDDFLNVLHLSSIDLHDIISVAEAGATYLKAKSRVSESFSFEGLRYGHRRYDPTRGVDYILSLAFKHFNGEHLYLSIEAFRGLTQPEIIPMPYVIESTRVNIVFFIQSNEAHVAERFLTRFLENVKVEHITLIFHLIFVEGESYLGKHDPYKDLKNQLKMFSKNYYNAQSRATFTHITVPKRRPSVVALLDLALTKLPADGLVLVADPRASFKDDFLNRVRMNTIRNWQVFSPIPFTLFHPNLVSDKKSYLKDDVTRDNGHFDTFDFSTLSFYVEDYIKARKSISKTVPLFRFEKDLVKDRGSLPASVYNLFANATDLHILRGIEPSLVLQYASIECPLADQASSSSVADREDCKTKRSFSLGTRISLSHFVSARETNQLGKDLHGETEFRHFRIR